MTPGAVCSYSSECSSISHQNLSSVDDYDHNEHQYWAEICEILTDESTNSTSTNSEEGKKLDDILDDPRRVDPGALMSSFGGSRACRMSISTLNLFIRGMSVAKAKSMEGRHAAVSERPATPSSLSRELELLMSSMDKLSA